MSLRVAVVASEGVHDQTIVGKILGHLGFTAIEKFSDLPKGFRPCLPKYPHNDSLRPAVPAPEFLRRDDDRWVVTVNAEGVDRLLETVEELMLNLRKDDEGNLQLDAMGIVLDADEADAPSARWSTVVASAAAKGLVFPTPLATLAGNSPRAGGFVVPDNSSAGTLEDLLLDCAAKEYPSLHGAAAAYVAAVDPTWSDLKSRDLKEFKKPAGLKKATVGAMGAILKPCKAIRTTFSDHRWVTPQTLALPRMAAFRDFLAQVVA